MEFNALKEKKEQFTTSNWLTHTIHYIIAKYRNETIEIREILLYISFTLLQKHILQLHYTNIKYISIGNLDKLIQKFQNSFNFP